MSARNGDKARFGKQRKRKMAHRARTRDLREGLPPAPAATATAPQTAPAENVIAPSTQGEHSREQEPQSQPQPQPIKGAGAEVAHGEHHGVLDSAAGAIGSVLGTLASKVKAVLPAESVQAE